MILDHKLNEIDLSKSSLFKLDSETGILVAQTRDASDIGTHNFTLAARLKDYPKKGYFPFNTTFIVEVLEALVLTSDVLTSYKYTIGTKMQPLMFKVNRKNAKSSV